MATMRGVTVRHLRDNLSKELKILPIAVIRDGQLVATILSVESYRRLLEGYRKGNSSVNLYNPAIHKTGDRVLVRKGKRLVEMIVPEIDADGQVIW